MIVDLVGILDHEDGGATIYMDLDRDALVAFATIGIRHVLIEKAKETVGGHFDAKGSGNSEAGEDSDPPIYGEFPGF